jgi:TRAP-type C4-dicarboxylate transport system substrate-binding protein
MLVLGFILAAAHAKEAAMAPTTTRRTLLAGGATLLAGRAAAQQATTLRLYSPAYETSAAMLAFAVPQRTGGRYQLERIIGFDMLEATLGKERAAGGDRVLLEGARSGELDLVVCNAFPVGEYVPEANAFYVPFLFRDDAHARAVLDGPIGQEMLGELLGYGLVGLAWTQSGWRHVANSKRPIRSPEDLRGIKLRTAQNPVEIEAFRTLGAEVVPMPIGKPVLDALAQGALDGVVIDIGASINWEMFRWTKYLSLTGHIDAPAIIVMSKAAYDKLGGRQGSVRRGGAARRPGGTQAR